MSKRTAASLSASASATHAKKAKRAPSPSPSAESESGSVEDFSDFQDQEAGEDDSEVDEFAQGNEQEDDDELISDDGEDLMAGLDDGDHDTQDAPYFGDDDSEDDDDNDSDEDLGDTNLTVPPVPAPVIKSKTRNSRAPKPLSPSEIRALAFAELTASPISSTIATKVTTFLAPLTPPSPSTSPLQPLLKAIHAHLVSLPSQAPSSLDALRNRGLVVPPVAGGKAGGKWAGLEYGFEKPKSDEVRVVGKWAWGGGVKVGGEYVVELAVAMPEVSRVA